VEDSFEDERFLRELLAEAAEARIWPQWIAWEAVFAATAGEACDLAVDGGFEAILLKLSLPDSRVLHETYMAVSSVSPATPILVIADVPDGSLEALLLREGAQDFLVKSELDAEPLARRLKYAVERQRHVNSLKVNEQAVVVVVPSAELGDGAEGVPLHLIAISESSLADLSLAE
jgi:DNA-binding response OmpR family regulator